MKRDYSNNPICKCKECGKEFIKKHINHNFCCTHCQLEFTKRQKRKNDKEGGPYKKICAYCNKEFETKVYNKVFCSKYCRKKASSKRDETEGLAREYTKDTIFIVHKYAMEGMEIKEIAEILHRSIDSIHEILNQPITSYQKACIMMYFNPYKKNRSRN